MLKNWRKGEEVNPRPKSPVSILLLRHLGYCTNFTLFSFIFYIVFVSFLHRFRLFSSVSILFALVMFHWRLVVLR
jgi:hypothetical protein